MLAHLSCSVMAVRLRNGDQQAASDALSTSLLIAGACGLATLLILEVTCLTSPCMYRLPRLMKYFGWPAFCLSADATIHSSCWLPFAEMGPGAH